MQEVIFFFLNKKKFKMLRNDEDKIVRKVFLEFLIDNDKISYSYYKCFAAVYLHGESELKIRIQILKNGPDKEIFKKYVNSLLESKIPKSKWEFLEVEHPPVIEDL